MIMKIFLSFTFSVLLSIQVWAQAQDANVKIYSTSVNHPDYIEYVDVMTNKVSFEPNENITYFWYSANSIIHTQGGYSGKLLHGKYTSN